jgi:dienelactone hydrolase
MRASRRGLAIGALGVVLWWIALAVGRTQQVPRRAAAMAPSWEQLRAAYVYDANKPLNVKTEPMEAVGARKWHLTFTGPNGEKVPGVFLRPKAEGVYPCVLLLHGLTSKKEDMLLMFGRALVENGVAVLALDAPHHGERKIAGENQATFPVIGEAVHEGNREYRRALDYLATRKDVDTKRIGLIGYSMGSIMGAILGGVEKRIGCFAFCVGGDMMVPMLAMARAENRERLASSCPSLYVGQIGPRPILMLNGKKDQIITAVATQRLYDAAKAPKKIEWYDSGHLLPREAIEKAVVWITGKLKTKIQ